jgi:hypothetical protein
MREAKGGGSSRSRGGGGANGGGRGGVSREEGDGASGSGVSTRGWAYGGGASTGGRASGGWASTEGGGWGRWGGGRSRVWGSRSRRVGLLAGRGTSPTGGGAFAVLHQLAVANDSASPVRAAPLLAELGLAASLLKSSILLPKGQVIIHKIVVPPQIPAILKRCMLRI